MHTTSPGKGLTIFLPFSFGMAIYIYTLNWKLKSAKISSAFNRFSIAKMQPKFNHFSARFSIHQSVLLKKIKILVLLQKW
jgi:hypothetical protein